MKYFIDTIKGKRSIKIYRQPTISSCVDLHIQRVYVDSIIILYNIFACNAFCHEKILVKSWAGWAVDKGEILAKGTLGAIDVTTWSQVLQAGDNQLTSLFFFQHETTSGFPIIIKRMYFFINIIIIYKQPQAYINKNRRYLEFCSFT